MPSDGIQCTALCPGFVATDMTDWVDGVPKEEMIQPEDIAAAVRYLLSTSPACIVPEIQFIRPGDAPLDELVLALGTRLLASRSCSSAIS